MPNEPNITEVKFFKDAKLIVPPEAEGLVADQAAFRVVTDDGRACIMLVSEGATDDPDIEAEVRRRAIPQLRKLSPKAA